MQGEKKQIFLVVGGTALIIGLFGWFSFSWQIGNIEKKFEEIQRVKLESFVWQEKLNQVFMLKRELPQIDEQSGEIEKMFVRKDDAVPLLQSLERAAVLAGTIVKIESVDLTKLKIGKAKAAPKKVETDESTKSIKNEDNLSAEKESEKKKQESSAQFKNMLGLSMQLTGDYITLVDFLRRMEGSPYFIQVLILDMAPAEKKSEAGAFQNGTLSGSGSADQPSSLDQEKNITVDLTVAVYANETK